MSIIKEFKEFAVKGNVVDMAVGIMIGAAFGTIVKSFVEDLITPLISFIGGDVDFSKHSLVLKAATPLPADATADAIKKASAVTLDYGQFLTNVISFLITAFILFLFVKGINRLKRGDQKNPNSEAVAKECPFCVSSIPVKAIKCPHCTAELMAK